MKKINNLYTLIGIIFFLTSTILGQNEEDVYRYSQIQYGGSARYHGVGGAFGAVGADFSVLSTNPAGMGRFRESDFSFTPTINFSSSETSFNGNVVLDSKQNININSIGIVAVSKAAPESPSLWRAVQFGFGYNKLANFSNQYSIEGVSNNSLSKQLAVDGFYIEPLDLQSQRPFSAGPAYSAWLIDPYDASGKTIYTTQMYVDSVSHFHTVSTKGGMGEWLVSLSGNYNEKLYLGGSIGFQRINYQRVTGHSETSLIDTTSLQSFTYTETLKTNGNGINLKLGAIFLPVKFIRIGVAYHTRSNFYNMENSFKTKIQTNFRDVTFDRSEYSYEAESLAGLYRYKMRTPSRLMGSLAVVVRKKGLISFDIEYLDYGKGLLSNHKFSGDNYTFTAENEKLRTSFGKSTNLKLGMEYRVTNLWMARAGVSRNQNGYNEGLTTETKPVMLYGVGLGYRSADFYLDLAYTITQTRKDYYMYDPALVSNTSVSTSINNIHATLGFKF